MLTNLKQSLKELQWRTFLILLIMLLSQMDCSKSIPLYPEVEIRHTKQQKKKKRLCISRGLRFRHFAEGNATITPACITINLKTAKDIEGKHQSPRLPEFYVVLSGDSVINF